MPRIAAANLAEHHDLMWSRLLEAFEGVLATKPYDDVTLADVAAAAGIARNTIYNYAPDKATLLAGVGERAGRGLVHDITAMVRGEGAPDARLRSVIGYLVDAFSTGAHRRVLLQSMFAHQGPASVQELSEEFTSLFGDLARLITEGMAAGTFRRTTDPELTVAIIAGAIRSALERVAVAPADAARVRDEVETFVLRALAA